MNLRFRLFAAIPAAAACPARVRFGANVSGSTSGHSGPVNGQPVRAGMADGRP